MEISWDFNSENTTGDSQTIGLSIIPVSSAKQPFGKWKEYQSKIAPISLWHSHYQNQGIVGIITGKVSGNLEIIDVDIKNDPKKTIMTEYSDLIPADLLRKLIIQTTPNNGFHLIYRCPEVKIDCNQKLALNSQKEIIIETRGEGGYFCTSMVNNKILQGTFDLHNLYVEIPVITK
jgi:hypothetical protein